MSGIILNDKGDINQESTDSNDRVQVSCSSELESSNETQTNASDNLQISHSDDPEINNSSDEIMNITESSSLLSDSSSTKPVYYSLRRPTRRRYISPRYGNRIIRRNAIPRYGLRFWGLKILLRGVPISINTNDIENELRYMNYPVMAVYRIHMGYTRRPVPMVLACLKNTPRSYDIYGIDRIFNIGITAEKFRDVYNNRGCTFSRCFPYGRIVAANFEDINLLPAVNKKVIDVEYVSEDGGLDWYKMDSLWAELYAELRRCTTWRDVIMKVLLNIDRIRAAMD